ncbi:PQQ-dependent sugar dehydrogenase [Zavarzinia aquatilis]|uniref:PQQ-dependent sugar dehydrogenase n=1 Tax=Zavarzinia aquatilis TaxID=2211142 RepID=UPI001FAFC4E6|nr:PQQ-dependent sugar dehydrogenase [Zavarzinia aquatilis]
MCVAAFLPLSGAAASEVGATLSVDPARLPLPYATPSAYNAPREVDLPAGALPQVPPGFVVSVFADGFDHARALVVAPDGAVLLAQSRPGVVTRLVDGDKDGRAEARGDIVTGLDLPHGLAFQGDQLFVGDAYGVWQLDYAGGAGGKPRRITAEGAFGETGGHWTRNIAFSADGADLFVAIGSESNIAEEAPPRATIQRFAARGGAGTTFATGLRNPVGLAVNPVTGVLWTVVNERDGLGDELAPDYLASVVEGGFYGWPYAYVGIPDPRFGDRRPDLVAASRLPEVLFRSHSAPLGLVFYTGTAFPPEYRGDAFIALHGSWNAGSPRGYQVARVDFDKGVPVANEYQVFVDGFRGDTGEGKRAEVWGRPAGLAVAADGALLVADDVANVIWRIAYEGKP